MSAVPDNAPRAVIVGLGRTGLSCARYLHARGWRLAVTDTRAQPPQLSALRALDASASACSDDSRAAPPGSPRSTARARCWASRRLTARWPTASRCSRRVGSTSARRRGSAAAEVIGDVELFARAANAPVIAVTGSNGKARSRRSRRHATSQGSSAGRRQLGSPALDILRDDADAYVLEISSFQMETTDSLRPLSAALLNVSSDHLDRHGTFERYAALKAKLLEAADNAVYNADDSVVAAIGARHPHATPVSVERSLSRGYSIVERGGERWLARDGEPLMKRAHSCCAARTTSRTRSRRSH
jgi:UDP-N-acetylmuramoylalanine--D-glutamate ligase